MSELDYCEVKRLLPHRYPFLLVDKVTEHVPFESIVAIKNVTHNEPHFDGHFPMLPVMPGVLIIEAMAQTSGILIYRSLERYPSDEDMFFLAGIDGARFKRRVVPGDQLTLSIEVIKRRDNLWKFKGVATVNGELACSAEFMNARA